MSLYVATLSFQSMFVSKVENLLSISFLVYLSPHEVLLFVTVLEREDRSLSNFDTEVSIVSPLSRSTLVEDVHSEIFL